MTDYREIRKCIEDVEDLQFRMFLKAIYLLGAAPVELSGQASPGTKNVYGPTGNDVSTTLFQLNQPEFNIDDVINFLSQVCDKQFDSQAFMDNVSKTPIALFTLKNVNEKKNWRDRTRGDTVKSRVVALPLAEKFEPWTKELYDYFRSKKDEYVFPFKRVLVNDYVRRMEIFKRKTYQIIDYLNTNDENHRQIKAHEREVQLYSLRYLRNDELQERYNFQWNDLEVFEGMKLRHKKRIPIQANKQLAPKDWRSYISKLCVVKADKP